MKSMTKSASFNRVLSIVLTVFMIVSMMSVFTLSAVAEGTAVYKIKFVDSEGNPYMIGAKVKAYYDTNPTVTVDENGIATFEFSGDKAEVKANVQVYMNGVVERGVDDSNLLFKEGYASFTLKKGEEVTYTIDTKAPVVTLTPSTTEWAKEVTLTATADEEVAGYIWNGEAQTTESTFVAKANGTYSVVAVDKAGNKSAETSVTLDKVDSVDPVVTLTVTPDTNYVQSVTVTITATDVGSGVDAYQVSESDDASLLDPDKWVAYVPDGENSYTVKDDKQHFFWVRDKAGRLAYKSHVANNVDNEQPKIQTVEPEHNNWSDTSINYKVTAEDNKSNTEEYKLKYGVLYDGDENITWETDGDEYVTITKRGVHTIFVEDTAGNISEGKPLSESAKIDAVAPVISTIVATDVNGIDVTTKEGNDNWTNKEVKFTVTASDKITDTETRENAELQYSIDGIHWQSEPEFTDITTAEVITFYVKDPSGRVSKDTKSANYDAKEPAVTTVKVDPSTSTKDPVKFTVSYANDGDDTNAVSDISGYYKYEYIAKNPVVVPAVDDPNWETSPEFTVKDSKSYIFFVKDKAGNVSPVNYDKDGKIVTYKATYDAKAPDLIANDNENEIYAITFEQKNDTTFARTWNKLTFGAFFNETVEIKVRATDNWEGSIHSATGVSLDKENSFKLYFYENGDKEKLVKYIIPDSVTRVKAKNYTEATFHVDQKFAEGFKGTIYYEIFDILGNTTEQNQITTANSDIINLNNMFMIESKAPQINVKTSDVINKGTFDLEFDVIDGTDTEIVSGINITNIAINNKTILLDEVYKTEPVETIQPVLSKNYKLTINSIEKTISINDGTPVDISDAWPTALEGKLNVEIFTVDNAGNTNTFSRDIQLDNTPANISGFEFVTASGKNPAEIVAEDQYGFFFNESVNVVISAADIQKIGDTVVAGVDSITYAFVGTDGKVFTVSDGENVTEYKGTLKVDENNTITVTVPSLFKGQIYAYATDKVGNAPEVNANTFAGYVHPYGTITETKDDHKAEKEKDGTALDHVKLELSEGFVGNKLYKDDVFVDVTVTDRQSSIAKVEWSIVLPSANAGEPGIVAEQGVVEITDDFNEEKATSYSDSLYDWEVKERDASLNPLSNQFGSHLTTQLYNSIKVSKEYNYDGIIVNVTMTDRAGNSTYDSVTFSIDSKAPEITSVDVTSKTGEDVEEGSDKWTNDVVTFTITGKDDVKEGSAFASQIVGYSVDPDQTPEGLVHDWKTEATFKFSDQKTHYFYVIDEAGNVSSFLAGKANYDNTKPEVIAVTPTLDPNLDPIVPLADDDWTNDTVYFVLDSRDEEITKEIYDSNVGYRNSGVAYYCMLDKDTTVVNPDWQPYDNYEFAVNDFKKHDFYVMDRAGNVSLVADNSKNEIRDAAVMFDARNPELVNVVFDQKNDSAFAKTVNFLTFGTFFNKTLKVTVNAKDVPDEINGASGVKTVDLVFKPVSGYEIKLSKEVDYNDSDGEKNSTTVFEIVNEEKLENFKGTVYVNIYDYAVTGKEAAEGEYAGNMTKDDVKAGEKGNSNISIECPEIMIENDAPVISDIRAYNEFENEPFVAVTGENIFKHNFNFEFDVNDKFDNNEFSGIHWVDVTVNGTHIHTTTIDGDDKNGKFYLESNQEELVTYTLLVDINDKKHTVDGKFIENWNNGVLEIKVNACDNAGNTATEKSRIVYLDETSAVIDGFTFEPTDNTALNTETIDIKAGENGLYEAVTTDDYGFYFQKDIDVTIYASDKTADDEAKASGVKEIEYKYIGIDETGAPVSVPGKAVFTEADIKDGQVFTTFTIPAGFKGQIYAYATDNVGNKPTDHVNYNGGKVDSDGYVHPEASIIETPEAHEAELNHIVFTVEPTEYTQNNGTPLYAGDVNVKIDVKDEYAGLRRVEWEVKAPQDTGNNYVGSFDIDNNGVIKYSDGTKDTSWIKGEPDKNLVTKLNTTLAVVNNSNDIVVSVKITDRAGNTSEEEIKFGIDKTIPTIDITYDNNTPDAQYTDIYNADRTATVVITERNFRAKDVVFKITSTDGTIPAIDLTSEGAWKTVAGNTPDKTQHVATFTYNADGDYTFDISYKDNAENAAPAVPQHKFTVDKTLPVIASVVYDNNDSDNVNYYKADRVATITIVEHNFDPARVVNLGVATDDGNPVTFPQISAWTTVGDTHTATVYYSADALYTFDIDFKDMAGNNIVDYVPHDFYVDKTLPSLVIDGVAADSANKDEGNIGFTITASDTNLNLERFSPVVKAMVLDPKTGKFDEKTINLGVAATGHNTATYRVTNLAEDGVYSITCTLIDKAGNSFSTVVLRDANGGTFNERVTADKPLITFSVNRNGSTFYVDDDYTKGLVLEGGRYYTQNVENPLIIKESNPDSIQASDVKITVNGQQLKEGEDYERTPSQNGGYTYTYTIFEDNFKAEGEYNIVISTKDRATNEAFSDMKGCSLKFVVDRTAPIVTVTGLQTNGRYRVEKQKVTLTPTDDGGLITKLSVVLTEKDGTVIDEIIVLEGEELADALAKGFVEFDIGAKNSAQYVKIICEDKAGNKIGADGMGEVFSNVTITTNGFLIFWANPVARYSAIAAVVVLAAAVIFFIVLKNKKKETEAGK